MILLAALTLVACGKDDELTAQSGTQPAPAATGPTTSETTPATATAPQRSTRDGCRAVAAPQPAANPERRRSKQRLSRNRRHTALVRTNCGTIEIRLDVRRAPKTTA
ncbi:hypothetical protein BH20ACT16_BH20ACT16_04790 [soil metagenome]